MSECLRKREPDAFCYEVNGKEVEGEEINSGDVFVCVKVRCVGDRSVEMMSRQRFGSKYCLKGMGATTLTSGKYGHSNMSLEIQKSRQR